MSILRRRYPNRRRSQTPYSSRSGRLSALITEVTQEANDLILKFNQRVALRGVPAVSFTPNSADRVPVSAVLNEGGTECTVTFDGATASATTAIIPHADPALRTVTGGFIRSGSFPVD